MIRVKSAMLWNIGNGSKKEQVVPNCVTTAVILYKSGF